MKNHQLGGAGNQKAAGEYKCIFFDLDHTLWDYECNARDMLKDLHESFNLQEMGICLDEFYAHFRVINLELWELYDRGLISNQIIRTQRFKRVLAKFSVDNEELNKRLSYEYLYGCPKKTQLVPHARETLEYLSQNYALTVVTNGFDEIQSIKLSSGNITHYFDHVITSQKAGSKKPAREIFEYALAANGLAPHEVIMIGDNLATDIRGARNAAIDTVYYNPTALNHTEVVSHEIRCLSELQRIL